MACTLRRPTPGHAKIVSVMTEPPSNDPSSIPTMVTERKITRLSSDLSLRPYAGVEIRVQDVHDEIDEDERRGQKEDRRLHDRIVAVVDGLHAEASHPRPRKDRLRDDRAAQQRAQLDSDDGHDGNRGVLEGVLPHDGRIAHALGASGPDEILAQDIEHAGPGEP